MSGTGRLVRRYLEKAIIEAGAAVTLRDPDVKLELAELEDGLDRMEAAALAVERIEERLEVILHRLDDVLERPKDRTGF